MTIREAFQFAIIGLEQRAIQSAVLDGALILMHATGLSKMDVLTDRAHILTDAEFSIFDDCLRKRMKFMPMSQILGVREFMGLEFAVNEHVLTPRPETELLVEKTLELCGANASVLEIGTGSGCIAICLAKRGLKVAAVDVSPEALDIAQKNAKTHEVNNLIDFVETDFLQPDFIGNLQKALHSRKKFDGIVSNPPYIPTSLMAPLPPEVILYEPKRALDGGADGLLFYKKIAEDAPKLLKKNGFVAVECGAGQTENVCEIFREAAPTDKKVEPKLAVYEDLAGIERVISAIFS